MTCNADCPPDDGASPRNTAPHFSRIRTSWIGIGIGLCVAIAWIYATRPFVEFPSTAFNTLSILALLSITGLVVGAVQKFAVVVGTMAGTLSVASWVRICGPQDPSGVILLLWGGISGILCGCIIGAVFNGLFRRAATLKAIGPGGGIGEDLSTFDAFVAKVFSVSPRKDKKR